MIFAGDFAQLPPVGGGKVFYADTIGTVLHISSSHNEQEATIGKALWHQFTTVVILRENMRQCSQSPDNVKLRKVLENLRYKSCTSSTFREESLAEQQIDLN